MNEKEKALLSDEEIASVCSMTVVIKARQCGQTQAWMKIVAQAQLDKCWDIWEQEIIYWRGWLQQVMSEHLGEGISEKTKEKVLEALNRF